MQIEERSYSGRLFRPRPEIFCDPNGSMCIVATPWGGRGAAKRAIQTIQDYFISAKSDREVTSPFQPLTCLSAAGNNLRVSIMLANDVLYREENRDQFHSGVELFVCVRDQSECAWTLIGSPSVYLARKGMNFRALDDGRDLSGFYSTSERVLAPLPQTLLGVAATSNFAVHSMPIRRGDQLVLLSRTLVPAKFLTFGKSGWSLQEMSSLLAKHSLEMPFWMGILNFD